MPTTPNAPRVRFMLTGFIGLAVAYAGTALYAFQLRSVDDTPEIQAAKAAILAERQQRQRQNEQGSSSA